MEDDVVEIEVTIKGRKLTIRGSDLKSLLSKMDEQTTIAIENIIAKLETVNPDLNSDSLKSLIRDLRPKSFYDKILTCIYHLYKQGTKFFNQNDLRGVFVEALFPLPQNMGDLLNKLQSRTLIAESSEKKDGLKAWYITQEGLDYVNNGFGGAVK